MKLVQLLLLIIIIGSEPRVGGCVIKVTCYYVTMLPSTRLRRRRDSRCRTRHISTWRPSGAAACSCGTRPGAPTRRDAPASNAEKSCSSRRLALPVRTYIRTSYLLVFLFAKVRKIIGIYKKNHDKSGLIWTYLDTSGRKWTTLPQDVVTLHCNQITVRVCSRSG